MHVQAPTPVPVGSAPSTVESPVPPRRRRQLTPYILALPSLLVLLALLAYPIYRMVELSLLDMKLRHLINNLAPPWVGLANYLKTLQDPFFWTVVFRTVAFAAVNVFLSVVLGLLIALLMQRVSRTVRLAMIATMMFAWAMPRLVSTQVFKWLVDADFGVVNWLVDRVPGVDYTNHSWFIKPLEGFTVVTAVVVWGALPFLAVTLHAGISQVPRELTEAAIVDGATAWHVFRNVTLPVLRPLLVIVTTLSIIWDMQVFEQIWVMRDTKPERDYFVLSIYGYQEAFGRSNYSLGSAIAVLTVLLMLGVMAFYIRKMFQIGEVD